VGVYPPGNWFAPPGSNQGSSGGNETAEASGAEGRKGNLASMQAITFTHRSCKASRVPSQLEGFARKENRTLTIQSGNFAAKNKESRFSLSLDTWAVTLALLLALLVGIGVLKHVPW
jgi:hypothetical protein